MLGPEEVLALCREALAARPDLLSAWTETIGQLSDMAHAEEAAALAGRPRHRAIPVMAELWELAARAHLPRGDRARLVEALTRAAELAPTLVAHAAALGLALGEASRVEEARAVFAEGVRRHPRDARVRCLLASTLLDLGECAPALEEVEHALRLAPDLACAWALLSSWSKEERDHGRPLRVARRLTEERPGDPAAWMALAQRLTGPGALEDRLSALRRAVAANVRHAGVHDELACAPAALGPSPPLVLRGRAAWIEARRGRRDRAIAEMRRLVAEQPGYSWGWTNLTEWYEAEGAADRMQEAAEQLTRLEPHSADAWATLGRARRIAGQRDDARRALGRALSLLPGHPWASLELLDTHVEDGALDAVEALVTTMDRTLVEHAHTRLAAAVREQRRRASPALRRARELCAARRHALRDRPWDRLRAWWLRRRTGRARAAAAPRSP